MAQNRRGPRKTTIAALIIFVALTPLIVLTMLPLGLQPPVAPPNQNPDTLNVASSTTTSLAINTSTTTNNIVSTGTNCQNGTMYTGVDSFSPALYNASSQSFPIFSMKAGAVATICVIFANTNTITQTANVSKSVMIGNYATKTFLNGTTLEVFTQSPNIKVTPTSSKLVIGGGAVHAVIDSFTISAQSNSKGFYFLNIAGLFPMGCDNEFRFAVGYTFTSSNTTGSYFPLPKGMGECIAAADVLADVPTIGGIVTQVYSTSGISITEISCGSFMCDLDQPQT